MSNPSLQSSLICGILDRSGCSPVLCGDRFRRGMRLGHVRLRSRNGHAVLRDELWLGRKDVAALRVHAHFPPVHIIQAVGGVITERLDTSEVFKSLITPPTA